MAQARCKGISNPGYINEFTKLNSILKTNPHFVVEHSYLSTFPFAIQKHADFHAFFLLGEARFLSLGFGANKSIAGGSSNTEAKSPALLTTIARLTNPFKEISPVVSNFRTLANDTPERCATSFWDKFCANRTFRNRSAISSRITRGGFRFSMRRFMAFPSIPQNNNCYYSSDYGRFKHFSAT